MESDLLNVEVVTQHLHDMRGAINLISNAMGGPSALEKRDVLSMAVYFDHALSCLCLSWQERWMGWDMIDRIDPNDFMLLTRSVAAWDSRLEIVPLSCEIAPPSHDIVGAKVQCPDSAEWFLSNALSVIERLLDLAHGDMGLRLFDAMSSTMYLECICDLCWAWNLWCYSNEDIIRPTNYRLIEDRISLPDWGIATPFRLVPTEWRLVVVPTE